MPGLSVTVRCRMQIKRFKEFRQEIRYLQIDRDDRKASGTKQGLVARLNSWVYRVCISYYNLLPASIMRPLIGLNSAYKAAEEHMKSFTKQKEQFEKEDLQPSGNAIIVFNDETSAQNMLWDYESHASSTAFSKLVSPGFARGFNVVTGAPLAVAQPPVCIPYIASRILACKSVRGSSRERQASASMLRTTNTSVPHAGGVLSPTPRMVLDTASGVTARFITVQRAPEPSDIIWENIQTGGHAIVKRRVFLALLYLLLLVVAFGAQLGLAILAEQERQKRLGLVTEPAAGKVRCDVRTG
jgi:hypothetical protein